MNLLKPLINFFKDKPKPLYKEAAFKVCEGDEKLRNILEKSMPYESQGNTIRTLSDEHQLELIKYIAQGLSPAQIVIKMKDNFNIKITHANVYGYRKGIKWKEKIKDLKKYYRERPELVDSSYKAVRIRRMEQTFDEAAKKGDLRAMVSSNAQIQEEFSKKDGSITTNVFWNNPIYQEFKNLSPEEKLVKRQELLKEQEKATQLLMQRQDKQEESYGPGGSTTQ